MHKLIPMFERFKPFLLTGLFIFLSCCGIYLGHHALGMTPALQAYSLAALVVLAYLVFCSAIRQAHQARKPDLLPALTSGHAHPAIVVVYASQTGYAEQLARQTAQSLHDADMSVQLMSIKDLTTERLRQMSHTLSRLLFIVSTTGEGDAPDQAAKFTRHAMSQQLDLSGLNYGILALGDRNYQHYCAFGHQLDQWLRQHHASGLFDLVEVDNGDEGALRHWQHHLGTLSGHTDMADWSQPSYERWTLSTRQLLNPGSVGGAAFHIVLTPPADSEPQWRAGDIVEIGPEFPPDHIRTSSDPVTLPHREYSIASIPTDGALELLVRQVKQANGKLGIGSGWLTAYARVGSDIAVRIRENRSFHPPATGQPMILIGNGTGLAGLRAHLKQRAADGHQSNWLIFGERNEHQDFFYREEIRTWQNQGLLERLDLAFSRDQEQRIYVQDKLLDNAATLLKWVQDGAAIYVCGSLAGMADGVDRALRQIIGDEVLEQLLDDGRYRRDVY
ncbi:sulfite reductase subunit alpha [Undibacterium sp. Rencai35W]|uniref:sulfite reductase subunit alpha n=1 Tax=Undibacterium sp. Rencai35W TaxID=3413046 RepID=UPI003BF2E4CA